MRAPASLLLDVGGSYIKSAVVESETQILHNVVKLPVPAFVSLDEYEREIDIKTLLNRVEDLIETQVNSFKNISKVFVSGQMGCYVIGGSQAERVVSWQDTRSLHPGNVDTYFRSKEEISESINFRQTGSKWSASLPIASIASSIHNLKSARKQENQFASLISYVAGHLTGNYFAPMHVSDAAASGYFNLITNEWDQELISRHSNCLFPSVVNEIQAIGFSKKYNFAVYVGVGDQQASLLGAGIESENVVVNIGTGGQVAKLHKDLHFDSKFQTRPFFGGQYLHTITHLPAGRALSAFISTFYGDNPTDADFEDFFAKSVLRTPLKTLDLVNFRDCLDAIVTSKEFLDTAALAPSFLHSMSEYYLRAIQTIGDSRNLIFAGGVGQKFKALSELISQKSGMNSLISQTEETTLAGLGLLSKIA